MEKQALSGVHALRGCGHLDPVLDRSELVRDECLDGDDYGV